MSFGYTPSSVLHSTVFPVQSPKKGDPSNNVYNVIVCAVVLQVDKILIPANLINTRTTDWADLW